MEYFGITFIIKNAQAKELLYAILDTEGFEGISEENYTVTGYIAVTDYHQQHIINLLQAYGIEDEVEIRETEKFQEKNWNQEWESNFDPIIIAEKCVVRAPFHQQFSGYKNIITIEPKMSFGTGHHETTRLMVETMYKIELKCKKVLDMGCGTGILAIFARQLGANDITAIDNDEWAYHNTIENIQRNNADSIKVYKGGKEAIPNEKFDVIIANINRNILLDQLRNYTNGMHQNSVLLLSGILISDMQVMQQALSEHNLKLIDKNKLNKWVILKVGLSS